MTDQPGGKDHQEGKGSELAGDSIKREIREPHTLEDETATVAPTPGITGRKGRTGAKVSIRIDKTAIRVPPHPRNDGSVSRGPTVEILAAS